MWRLGQRRVRIIQTVKGLVPSGVLSFASGLLPFIIGCTLEKLDNLAADKWKLHGREAWKDFHEPAERAMTHFVMLFRQIRATESRFFAPAGRTSRGGFSTP
jgi:hypothetical protein